LKRKNQRSKENYLATKYVFLTVAMGCLKLHILEREYAPMKIVYGGKYGKDERTDFYRQGTGNGSENLGVVYRVQQSIGGGQLNLQPSGNKVNEPWVKTVNDIYGQSTFIPGTALSFVEKTKYGRWASMGGLKFSTSPYSVQKALINDAKWAGKFVKNAGNTLGVIGIGITLYDMKVNGVNTSNSIDMVMGIISFVPGWGWIAGGIYFIGNAALKATTKKDIGEFIDSW
jgi:hypothetical protein